MKWVYMAKMALFITYGIFFPIANFAIFYPILMILVSNITIFGSGKRLPLSKIGFCNYITQKLPDRWKIWGKN